LRWHNIVKNSINTGVKEASLENETIQKLLEGIDLFSGVQTDQLTSMLKDSYIAGFELDEVLFRQGDLAKVFYVLQEGRIKLSQLTPEGDKITLHYLKPGDAFGIIAVLREIEYPVTAEAVEKSRCIAWKAEHMRQWIVKYPRIALNSIRILSGFILDFQDRIRELSTERVERRIARSLQRLSSHAGKQSDRGITLSVKLTRQDIAEMSGTTLYTVSRTLNKWETLGLVDCKTANIVIKKPLAIADIAEDIQSSNDPEI